MVERGGVSVKLEPDWSAPLVRLLTGYPLRGNGQSSTGSTFQFIRRLVILVVIWKTLLIRSFLFQFPHDSAASFIGDICISGGPVSIGRPSASYQYAIKSSNEKVESHSYK
jgi:hypothetical protein